MGKISKVHRYQGKEVQANVYNARNFGSPAYSLYTSTKLFSLNHKIIITDADGNVAYTSKTKFFTLHDKTRVYDASGKKDSLHKEKVFYSS